jgi:hypothetical protein
MVDNMIMTDDDDLCLVTHVTIETTTILTESQQLSICVAY